MRITTNVHTIFMLVGPTECGKTTFAKEVLIPGLRFEDESRHLRANVQYLSSDGIRQEVLGHEYDKYDPVMLEASEQAFHLLFEKLKMATSFPINAEFIVLDTTGLAEDFREKVRTIAKENNYHLEVILFDYRNREDYYASERSRKLISSHIHRMKKEVLRAVTREGYTHVHRVRAKDFFSPKDAQANPAYEIVIENREEYLSTILPVHQKYVVVGDVHECVEELKGLLLSHGFAWDGSRLVVTDKVRDTKVILAGDWIDKGKNTREIISFLAANQEHFLFVAGNHENFVYKYLRGEAKGVDPDLLETFFDSIQVLAEDEELKETFYQLFSLAKPFYRSIARTGPSFYVTHAPCKKKYLGKLDANSVRHQRNFRIDRSASLEKQLSFLGDEAVSNHPFHIFGHISAKQPFRIKNKIHIDTGCVYGNTLTSVVISHKPLYKSQKSRRMVQAEELNALFQREEQVSIQELDPAELRKLHACMANQVNFISGTMAPADKEQQAMELESLRAGLRYYADRGIEQVVLQPKYMGSRCNLYVHREIDRCFAVSRNGYRINQVDLTEVYRRMLSRFGSYMEENQIEMLLLDGELLPWRAIGEGLIEKQFRVVEKALESELAFLQANGFEQAWGKLVEQYEQSGFEKDQFHQAKGELIEKYGPALYQNYKHIREQKEMYVPLEQHMEACQTFKKQLELYAGEGEIEYKPFALLKAVYADGSEQIPQGKTSELFSFVSDDECLVVTLSEPKAYERAEHYYSNVTQDRQMEGIVIKPERDDRAVAPFLKVRNPDYLSIVYGYDYRFPHKYRKLMKQKSITQKLKTSMQEYRLGTEMLAIRFADISPTNDAYRNVAASLLFEVAKEKEIDPRL